MNNRGNLNLGDEIKNIVQNALNNKDFNKLNQDVQNVVKDALDEVRKSIDWKSGNHNNWNNQKSGFNNYNYNQHINEKKSQVLREQQNKNQTNNYNKGYIQVNNKSNSSSINPTKYIVPAGQVSGMLFTVFGIIGSIAFGIAVFVLTLLGSLIGSLFNTIAVGLLPLFILSIILSIKGSTIRKRLKRFQKYILCLGDQSYCLINDLSSSTGLSNKFIEKDLRKMIEIGMFPEGHIDNKKTTFILTDECYKQYLEVQYLEVKKNIASKNSGKKDNQKFQTSKQTYELEQDVNNKNGLNPEMRKSLAEGRKFVLDINEANVAILGEEISRKLDRLEEVTGKIFDYVENHPEKFTEIRKFTEYFLPTTLKLVDAYRKLDYQPIQGENISSAKKEIEETMDTINLAFENLLDDLFQDMAMDISTDISVLETMLAQEGLTDNNMRVKNKTMEDK